MRKVFGDTVITTTEDERFHVEYGASLGAETFLDGAAMTKEMSKWSDAEIGRLSKRLADITKLRRWLAIQ